MKIDVLGSKYSISFADSGKDSYIDNNNLAGYCDSVSRKIVILKLSTLKEYKEEPLERLEELQRRTMRHELVHAFLNESGLSYSALCSPGAWSKNEEMVDWIALQAPKIHAAFVKAGCI